MVQKAGLHHISKRKRAARKQQSRLEPYPHPKRWINGLDKFLIFIAVIGPLTSLPQIYEIFAYKSAENVSLTTWLLFDILTVPWLVYSLVHKDKPLIVSSVAWLTVQTVIVTGLLLYG